MKKILVTGGSGFIGTNLVNFLLKKQYLVSNIDKLSDISTPEKFKDKNINYIFYKFNLSNEAKLKKILLKKFDIIIHLAAESHVDRSIDRPKLFFSENINSTLTLYDSISNLVKLKKISSPKIIHISTDEVYGSNKTGLSNENSKIFTSSPYSASKAASENIAQSYSETYSLKTCILRISNNYGPFQSPEKFIPKMISRILEKKVIPLYSKGENIREWIYIEDTCGAILKVIENFKDKSIYNVGSSIRFSNIDLLKKMFKKFQYSHDKIKYVKDRPGHDYRYALNSSLFRKDYKWKPKYNFNTGMLKTISWYKKNNKWLKAVKTKFLDIRIGKI